MDSIFFLPRNTGSEPNQEEAKKSDGLAYAIACIPSAVKSQFPREWAQRPHLIRWSDDSPRSSVKFATEVNPPLTRAVALLPLVIEYGGVEILQALFEGA